MPPVDSVSSAGQAEARREAQRQQDADNNARRAEARRQAEQDQAQADQARADAERGQRVNVEA